MGRWQMAPRPGTLTDSAESALRARESEFSASGVVAPCGTEFRSQVRAQTEFGSEGPLDESLLASR
jgi:hypothetical protein